MVMSLWGSLNAAAQNFLQKAMCLCRPQGAAKTASYQQGGHLLC